MFNAPIRRRQRLNAERMVNYGILSDIHGNLEALIAGVEALSAAGCEQLVCAGDVVGYGPNPNECCDLLQELNCPTVQGNHDLAAIGAYDIYWFNDSARAALEWTGSVLTPKSRAFLAENPQVLHLDDFAVVHGSLVSPVEQYLETLPDVQPTFDKMREPLCFVGHTHVALVFSRGPFQDRGDRQLFGRGGELQLRDRWKYVVNCGSIGQPRDRNPDGGVCVYDSTAGTIRLLRVPYPLATTQEKMRAARFPHWLVHRLATGT